MNLLRLALLSSAVLLGVASLRAQTKPIQHATERIELSFAVKADVNCYFEFGFEGQPPLHVSNLAHSGITQWNRNAPLAFTGIIPGVAYQIHLAAGQSSWEQTDVRITAPPGYKVYLKSPSSGGEFKPVSSYVAAPIAAVTDHHYALFMIVPNDGTQNLGPGQMTAPSVRGDFLVWSAGLGVNKAGRPVGTLQLRLPVIDTDAFERSSLTFEAHTDDVTVTSANGEIETVTAPQALSVNIDDITQQGALDGYIIDYGSTLGVQIYVQKEPQVGGPDRLRIERRQGGRSQIYRVTQTGTTVKSWTVEELGLGRTTTYVSTLLGNGDRQEDATLKDAANVVASKSRRIYHVFTGSVEELIQEVSDPDGAALTTTYEYYYDSGDAGKGWWGKLKSVTRPDGSWVKYEYYGDGTTGEYGRWGQLKSTMAPWQDTPSSAASATTTNCKLTLFDYAAERSIFQEELASTETKINNQTVSLSSSSVAFGTSANSQPLRTETNNSYSGSGTYLTTIRKSYHRAGASDYAGRLYSQTNPDGSKVSAYYTFGSSETSAVTLQGWSTNVGGGATQVSTMDGKTIDPIYLVPNRSTKRVEWLIAGETSYADVETYIYTSSGTWEKINHTSTRTDGPFKIYDTNLLNGAGTYRQWEDGVPILDTANDGTLTGYSCDALGRVVWQRKYNIEASGAYPAQDWIYTHFKYDAAGRVLWQRTNNSSDSNVAGITTSTTYDLAGRPTSSTDADGLVTTYSYDAPNRRSTVTVPGGATKITEHWRDGSTKSVTGTAVTASYSAMTVNGDGTIAATSYALRASDVASPTAAPRWTKTTTDWAGRTVKQENPAPSSGTFTKLFYYDSVGRPWKTTEPNLAASLTTYNVFGEVQRSGLDIDGNGLLEPASNDRLSESETVFEKDGTGAWWSKATALGYNQSGSATAFTKGVTKSRITGFSGTLQSETLSTDIFGNQTRQTFNVDRNNRLVTATTDVPDSTTDVVSVSRNGLTQSVQSAQGLVSRTYYDSLGRVLKTTDPRTDPNPTPARIAYATNSLRVVSQQDSAGNTTTFGYDSSTGRVISTTNPLNKTAYTSYNLRGQVIRSWGQTTYPVEYGFNDYGEQTTLSTFRGGSGWDASTWPMSPGTADITTWAYDTATGVLLSKTDAAGRAITYAYNTRGQLATRTWARGVTTNYSYSTVTGEQTGIDYSDSTPDLAYTYNRLGQTATISDAIGARTFAYSSTDTTLTSETFPAFVGGRALTRSYDTTTTGSKGRNIGFTLTGANATGADYSVSYGYDAYGRFNNIVSGGVSHTYGFAANTNLIGTISETSGWGETMTYESNRNLLASINGTFGSSSKAQFAYTHDVLGRRATVAESGEAFSRYIGGGLSTIYGYNDRSEVISAQSYHGSNPANTSSPVAGRGFGYVFDNIGSRTSSTATGATTSEIRTTTYANNNLNQVTARTAPASTDVSGLAPAAATVTVNGSSSGVTRQGDYYYKNVSAPSTPLWHALTASSNLGGNSTRYAYLAATPESFTYDLDGNVTDDGRWHYTWDAENRLTSMETSLAAQAAGVTRQLITINYDYLGRRVRKMVANWNGSTYVLTLDRKFIYNSWNLVTELDGLASNAALARYTWGLDLSGNLSDGGGVGGLLAILDVPTNSTHLPAYDANGNIHALVNRATGALSATYEYSPFGETLRATGTYAATNNFRFSTKYADAETGLLYYGYRYYQPSLGRWLGRDPIAEKGGLNLYGFCGNNGVNRWDYLGMWADIYGWTGTPDSSWEHFDDSLGGGYFDHATQRVYYYGSTDDYDRNYRYADGPEDITDGNGRPLGGGMFGPTLSHEEMRDQMYGWAGGLLQYGDQANAWADSIGPVNVFSDAANALGLNGGNSEVPAGRVIAGTPVVVGDTVTGTTAAGAPNSLVVNAGRHETGVRTTTGGTDADKKADGLKHRGDEDHILTPPTVRPPAPEPARDPLKGMFPGNPGGRPLVFPDGFGPITPPKDWLPYGWTLPPPRGSNWNIPPAKLPQEAQLNGWQTAGLLVGGAAIIAFDIATVPSGEGTVGVIMIRTALRGAH